MQAVCLYTEKVNKALGLRDRRSAARPRLRSRSQSWRSRSLAVEGVSGSKRTRYTWWRQQTSIIWVTSRPGKGGVDSLLAHSSFFFSEVDHCFITIAGYTITTAAISLLLCRYRFFFSPSVIILTPHQFHQHIPSPTSEL